MRFFKNKKQCITAFFSIFMMFGMTASAEDLTSSKIVTGTQNLLQSVNNAVLIIAPLAGIAITGYCLIRRSMADEQDHKRWQSRIMIAIVSTVGAVLASVIINLVLSYYR